VALAERGQPDASGGGQRDDDAAAAGGLPHVAARHARLTVAVRARAYRRAIDDALRHHRGNEHLAGAFGTGGFGALAEKVARFFGTPHYIVGQSIIVVVWVALNAVAVSMRWDPYPFILLNLAFSTQAAYAAPLILLAQTRQADRDKASVEADARHREEIARRHDELLEANTRLTERVEQLLEQIHTEVCKPG
jgi:uncharacterized membrane protein